MDSWIKVSFHYPTQGPGLDYDSPFVTPFMYAEYTFTGIFILEVSRHAEGNI